MHLVDRGFNVSGSRKNAKNYKARKEMDLVDSAFQNELFATFAVLCVLREPQSFKQDCMKDPGTPLFTKSLLASESPIRYYPGRFQSHPLTPVTKKF